MPIPDDPMLFYIIEDCDLCNCTGQLRIKTEFGDEYESTCPICNGNGALKKKLR